MEVKHFNYEEFIKVKIKSLNCDSCGAGLVKTNDGDTCDCKYCGNTNLILDDGKTKLVQKELPKPELKENESPSKISKAAMIGIAVLGIVFAGAVAYYYYKKKSDNDKNKRKRLLLINS